jgi:hypothetical protein
LQSINRSTAAAEEKNLARVPTRSGARVAAKVMIEGQAHGFLCSISQMTEQSAIITATGWLGVPDRFSLLLRPEGVKKGCRVTARRGNSLTVAFED